MKLTTLLIVRDASPTSTLADICFSIEVPRLGDYIIGSGPGVWAREQHTIYTEEAEARADAEERMARMRPATAVPGKLYPVRRPDGSVVMVSVPPREDDEPDSGEDEGER